MLCEQLEVILVEPQTPANVGAVARACRNFGVSRLCIVGSPGITEDGLAKATAHACEDLLANARLVTSVEAALAPHVFVVGTANRVRKGKLPPLRNPHEVLPEIAGATLRGSCGLLFGPESTGLTDVDLARCTQLLRIPTAVDQPSLNLSQAVMVTVQECWRLSQGWTAPVPPEQPVSPTIAPVLDDLPSVAEYELLLQRVESLMNRAGFRPYAGDPETFRLAARRSLGRARFERRDLRTLLTIVKTLERL